MFEEHSYSEDERKVFQAKVERAANEQKEREERIQQKIADRKMPSYEDLVQALANLVGKDGIYENVCTWEIDEAKRVYQAAAELVPQHVWLLHDGWENTIFGRQYRCKIMDVSAWSLEELQEKPEAILDELQHQDPLIILHGDTQDNAKFFAKLHCKSHYWQFLEDKRRMITHDYSTTYPHLS
jgi:hypothetical protein